MRLFIAAELPGEVVEALAETSAMLRGCMRGRYVAPDSFHVTLAFLGDVEAARVNDAIDALEEGCRGAQSIDVALGELGSFGRRSKATLWQGFREADQLQDLAQSVRAALQQRNLPFDDKPFRAHVTLMRAADLSKGALPSPALAEGRIEHVTLFKSDLSGPRPVYEPLHTVKLG
ncbi:MAG: RNA 2',3'-cyclic phosphodiesterase [Eggerthellaceae bacterium]|nr:RNA 2',3'-cyclic phosphodiesterase [Eggerthellaceae bacterium]